MLIDYNYRFRKYYMYMLVNIMNYNNLQSFLGILFVKLCNKRINILFYNINMYFEVRI